MQGFIQAISISCRRQKKLNLLLEFSNSILIKHYLKGYYRLTCSQNKLVY